MLPVARKVMTPGSRFIQEDTEKEKKSKKDTVNKKKINIKKKWEKKDTEKQKKDKEKQKKDKEKPKKKDCQKQKNQEWESGKGGQREGQH